MGFCSIVSQLPKSPVQFRNKWRGRLLTPWRAMPAAGHGAVRGAEDSLLVTTLVLLLTALGLRDAAVPLQVDDEPGP